MERRQQSSTSRPAGAPNAFNEALYEATATAIREAADDPGVGGGFVDRQRKGVHALELIPTR